MDSLWCVFVLFLNILHRTKAAENCDMQYCQKCFSSQVCAYCELGRFGHKCDYECRANFSTCSVCRDRYFRVFFPDKVCLGCKGNEYASRGTCLPCHEGYFGTFCREVCPNNCLQCVSHELCTSCRNGWSGKICQCSTNCEQNGNEEEWCSENGVCLKGCKSGRRGDQCDLECLNKENCLLCDQFNGECLECSEGWYGSLCNKKCGRCQPNKEGFIQCNVSTGECIDGCVSRWHGDICQKKCNLTCANGTCDVSSSFCNDGCVSGWFGSTCNEMCNVTCVNMSCDQDSGYCDYGCVSGWYGDKCEYVCSENCEENICDRQTAKCSFGCKTGFKGLFCNATEALKTRLNLSLTNVMIGAFVGIPLLVVCVLITLLLVRLTRGGRVSILGVRLCKC